MRTSELVDLAAIQDARRQLEGVAVATPLDRSRALSERVGGEVFVKCENLQRTGSFKIRGAYNFISRLNDDERRLGVVAASAGNHAQGVALAAKLSTIHATIFMPESASLPKVEATTRYGGEVRLVGKDFGAALAAAHDFCDSTGSVFVHPFDNPHVIAGQGTIGLEIDEELGEIGTVVVPIGGGGLISGIAAALRARRPGIRIVGVQASGAASFRASLDKGELVSLPNVSTIADGIAANAPGNLTFGHVQGLVDEVVCVDEDEIAEALVFTVERMKLVLEPAGATTIAALLTRRAEVRPPVVAVLSGGNIDPLLLLSVIRFGLSVSGRYFTFHTRIPDRPGELARLLALVAELGANIVGVEHHREGVAVHLGEVDVALQLETKGREHIDDLTARLIESGYQVARL